MNKLEFGTKKKAVFSIALLHTQNLRDSRNETEEGRKLYNKELDLAEKKVKQYHINLNEDLPNKL